MEAPQTFEQSWEAFRLANDISQEEFVASGYGFVEKLEHFVELQKWTRIIELEKLILKYETLIEDTHKACLCERSLKGFDYHETHPTLGKSTGRWFTPKDLIESRLGFNWVYSKPEGVCDSYKLLKMNKNKLDGLHL